MDTTKTIAIIGSGNMGASLLGGLIANHYPPQNLWITDLDTEKLNSLQQKFSVNTTTDNNVASQKADIIILAVKPQIIKKVVEDLAPIITANKPLIISIAAGVRINNLQQWLDKKTPIVRAMPNTPALISCGATALYANDQVTSQQKNLAESILRAVSVVVWVDQENLLDVVTALSGSGPAYFFLIIEALQNAAEKLGLSADVARLLTLQTALGAARMALESEKDIEQLRAQVTSPGGTTEAAIKVLEDNEIRKIFHNALTHAKERSEELAKLLGQ